MKKSKKWIRLVILFSLFLAITGAASADSQWDISLNVPYYLGIESSDGTLSQFNHSFIPIPDVKWHYYFGGEKLHFGVGFRFLTLILESAVYPMISLESNLGNFVINAGFGGGLFLFFGLENAFEAGTVFLPELSVAYKLGKRKIFSLGTAGTFLLAPSSASLNEFALIGTVFVRWTL